MKRIAVILAFILAFSPVCLAETSHTDDFLSGLSQAWDGLRGMASDAGQAASEWANDSGVTEWVEGAASDVSAWFQDFDLSAWIGDAGKSISTWFNDAGAWTEEAAAKLQAFVEENEPAVEAWLNQAGEDVRNAWETLTNPDAHTKEEVQEAYETVSDTLQGTQIANPWVDLTKDELEQASGVSFGMPDGAENVIYRWLESESLAEMQFTLDGDEYCARIQPAALEEGELLNISGMYFAWENEEEVTIGHCKGTIGQAQTGSEEFVELCQWYDVAPGLMYALSVYTTDLDGLDLAAVAEMVYIPMQGE